MTPPWHDDATMRGRLASPGRSIETSRQGRGGHMRSAQRASISIVLTAVTVFGVTAAVAASVQSRSGLDAVHVLTKSP
jgi:hypothetical protein